MAYEFNGTDENLRGTLPVTGYPYTIAGWFRTADVTQNEQCLMALVDDSGFNDYQELQFASTPRIRASSRNDAGGFSQAEVSASGIANGEWHHAGGVFASATSRIAYYDGTGGTELTASVPFSANIDIASIGNSDRTGAGWHFFNGGLAEMAAWNAALTPAEMAALAKGFSPRLIRPQSLVLYVPLVRSTLDQISGVALAEVNTPTVGVHVPIIYPFKRRAISLGNGGTMPTISTVTPDSAQRGSTLDVTVEGTAFAAGDAVTFSDSAITVNNTTFVSATELTVNISLAPENVTDFLDQSSWSPSPTTATLLSPNDIDAFQIGDVLRPGDSAELMLVTDNDGVSEITVTRGYEGTTPIALEDGMTLTAVRRPSDVTVTPLNGDPDTLVDGFELLENTGGGGGGSNTNKARIHRVNRINRIQRTGFATNAG